MSFSQQIEALEHKLQTLEPEGMSEARLEAFEEQKRRLSDQLARLRFEEAESWGKQDWLAMIENSLDILGERVADWVAPEFKH